MYSGFKCEWRCYEMMIAYIGWDVMNLEYFVNFVTSYCEFPLGDYWICEHQHQPFTFKIKPGFADHHSHSTSTI